MHRIIIDTDPGIDDAMAIHLAFAHPEIEMLGLSAIYGNVSVAQATRNACVLVDMAGQPVPVARGAEQPLIQAPHPPADFAHGTEGFGDLDAMTHSHQPDPRSAAQFLVDSILADPGNVTVCAVGPLTNLALALEINPEIATQIKQLVIMGGVVNQAGNVSEWSEANIWQDPHAADKVFAARWPMTMVGLDVTTKIQCTPEDFASLAASNPKIGGFLNSITPFYIEFHRARSGEVACYLHDPSAVLFITNPELFTVEETPLKVICEGEQVGRTVRAPDSGRAPVKVTVAADLEGVRAQFLSVLSTADAVRASKTA
ncbi:MAG: nucleoside hydrolase [Rhodospirillaceae bacterium]